jgi:SAM-dependent methyltransferase
MIEIRHTEQPNTVYDDIFSGEAIHQMDSFFIWALSLLGVDENTELLDIATGRGQMVQYALQKGATAFGLDFSWKACQLAYKREPDTIICSDAHELPFANDRFDAVTNIGSLEHLENMEKGIKEMARVLKPAGRALLTVPNTFGLRWNVQYAWRTGDVDDDGQPIQRYGTRKQWEQLLEGNGLKVEKVLGYEHERSFPRTKHDLINYLKHPRMLFSMLFFVPLIPVNMAGQFVFICKV